MFTKEQNDLLTQTGPGTPLGGLMRRYWLPALLSEEIPDADCPPVRVHIVGEDLVAFRWNSQKYYFSLGVAMEGETDVSVKLGGGQIEHEDEEPMIHDLFEQALGKAGTQSQMAEFIPRLKG